jgi:hypothetical protein
MYGLYLSLILFAGGLIVSFVGSRSVAATAGPSNRRWVIGMFCAANVAVFLSLTVLPGVGRTFDSSFWTPPGQNEFEADLGNLVLRMSHDMGWHHAIGATVVSLAASMTAFFWAFRITAKSARTAEQSGEPEPPIKRDLKS